MKALVIGIDSASPFLIEKWIDKLPNIRSVFSYEDFVKPMIERIRREAPRRFYQGRPEQIAPSDATPTAQESARGAGALGPIIGGIVGAGAGIGIGFAIGGIVGAVIGGIVGAVIGLVGGRLIGGLLGSKRPERPAV